ncbi:7TM diverse intracellular signaling domain-containing protein [Poseidonibacter sp.]|uniref:7TM diverse intracellular signaling domain-containing protein n=1 Tax=Poseidonibacter sp. TaxID=2321188 RepID=UPI003C71CE4B
MIKQFILFISISCYCFSHTVNIDELNLYINQNDSHVFITKDEKSSISEIKKKEFIFYRKNNFPRTSNIIWSKIVIRNSKDKEKKLFLRNIRSGIDYINVYILKNDVLVKTLLLGDLREQNTKDIISKKSSFEWLFDKDSIYTIYFKYKSLGAISNQWEIYEQKDFLIQENTESLIWGAISGIIIAIIFYNFLQFLSTKNKSFLFYILSSFFSLMYLLSLNGILYALNLGINLYFITISTWIFAYLFIIFTILLVINLFEETKSGIIYKLLVFLIYIQLIILVLLSIGFYENKYHYDIVQIDILSLLSFFLVFIISAIELYKHKNVSFYFLLGQTFYITCFIYITLEIIGIIPISYHSWIILPFGLLLEVIFISVALNKRLEYNEKEKDRMEKELLEQSRFINAGKTISYIIHQIKHPISQLGSQINLIEATLMFDKDNLPKIIKSKLPKIKSTFEYINEISHSVETLFLNPNGKEKFNIKSQIEILLNLHNDSFINFNITVEKNIDDIEIMTFKGSLSNIIMVIIENAIYEIKEISEYRIIKIICYYKNNSFFIIIENSGKKILNLERIFDINYSTKLEKGSGIGLSLARNLTQKKLNGKLKAENTTLGARFTLEIPSSKI